MSDLFMKTLQELFARPRNVVDGFLNGQSREFSHPFIFCMSGAVIIVILNLLLVDFSVSTQTGPAIDHEQLQIMTQWIEIANIRAATQFLPFAMVFLLVPSLSLAGLFFFRNKLNGFYSNLVLNAYATGVAILLLVLMIPVWMFSGIPLTDPLVNSSLPALLTAGVILWIYRQYFQVSSAPDWLKTISSFITGYVLFVILNGFAAGVFGYMIYAVRRIWELTG